MKIVADEHIPYIQDYFQKTGELILKPGRAISARDVKDAEMLIVRSVTRVDAQLLSGSAIKFVGSVTAGADHLDTAWLDQAGILWNVANGFNAPPVADYVVSAIAVLQKQRILANKNIKAAVIGVGNVGRMVVDQLKILGIDVVLCDPLRAKNESDFSSLSIEDLTDVDLISLHVPLTKTGDHPTYHFINKAFLERQKPACVLLNASRGAVINSSDLLAYGTHLHWCFDVFEHEPEIDKKILQQCVLATPHIAGYSVQSKMRGIDMIYRIACDKMKMAMQTISLPTTPYQELGFAGSNLHWQDIVLGVFNPLIITEMMREMLLNATSTAILFDEMRQQFNYRHEFGFTKIMNNNVTEEDKVILKKLGFLI